MKTLRLHLLRHGLTQGNLDGLYIGHTDLPLCEAGRKQLSEMKAQFRYPETQFIFSSPLKRCLETAEILYPGVRPMVIDALTEYDFGEYDGRSAEELHEKSPIFDRWLAGEPEIKPPFGESNEDFTRRVCSAFARIVEGLLKTGTDDAVILSHGGVLMAIMANFALPEAPATDWLMPSGCGYTLRIDPTLWMAGQKAEALEEIPLSSQEQSDRYYEGWDYYPDDDDFDVSEFV